ncbi:MAG: phosphoribosylanthranilate isomerase [Elusimicrobiota bacterium]|jgi:phosphoribosylanthranilate isomerase|nr:phosphoribosylanthranilate isomerase [Elusimicrobiota bacterium]
MAKIKICGLTRECDIGFVNLSQPDFAGFVFAGTKRKIDFKTAKNLSDRLDKNIKAVGVFVNEALENIIYALENKIIDIVQLHGDEDEEFIKILKSKINVPVIKVFRVNGKITTIKTSADFVLFDTFSAFEYGGTGETFDWNLIKNCKGNFFVSGGLNLQNLENVIKNLNPYCIDLSSGVETNGVKDSCKILDVIKLTRTLNF